MIEWNEERLAELVRKMGLRRTPGQGKIPIHRSLYRTSSWGPIPILTQIVLLDATAWAALGYAETDRVSLVRYLGSLECEAKQTFWSIIAYRQHLPLDLVKALVDIRAFDTDTLDHICRKSVDLELAKLLIDAGACNKGTLSVAAEYQQPLSLELAKLLVDAGAFNEWALSRAAENQSLTLELTRLLVNAGCDPAAENFFGWNVLQVAAYSQHPLTPDLAKLLLEVGCDPTKRDDFDWDALVLLAAGGHPVDPQVTDLFLSAGCRTDLDGCECIEDEHRLRFDRILKEHAEWKEQRDCLIAENSPAETSYGPDWGR